ncbi:MAG TPA: S41 family peptidase, partial [Pseudonocardia sp.]|nr:S41 family peptidase [Pseudonocardia sp.]
MTRPSDRPTYLRFPHVHGDTLVFVAEDDVWTAPLGGGRAYRLTVDSAPAEAPRLAPDGTRVAWTSNRAGSPEVFVADVDGGAAQRLTWWGDGATRGLGWTPDGDVLAASAAGLPTRRRTWAHAVPAGGGAARRLPYGPLSDLALDAAGAVLLLSTTDTEMAWWKRYRGGTAGRLWWDPDGAGEFTRILADLDGQLGSPMLVGDRIAFLSDHEGWGNLYSVDRSGGDLRRHTDHGAPGEVPFYVRHASTDRTRVVYESAGELWLVESLEPGASPRRLDVRLGGPRTAREPFRITASSWLDSAVPDRTGRVSVVVVRGTVHRLTHRDGPARTLLARPGARARLAQPLGERDVVWVDDVEGEDAVCVVPLDPRAEGAAQPRRYGAGEIGRVLELTPAPDGSAVAVAAHDGRLLLLDLREGTAGEFRELACGADGEVSGLAWSPDSAWLAYADPVEAGISRIVLVRIADGTLVAVTEPRFVDIDPVFTTDGRFLAFLSKRSFDPIYDQHSFDLTFPAAWRPFLVPLAARTPSPFGASPDGRPTSPGDEGPEDLPAVPPAPPDADAPAEGTTEEERSPKAAEDRKDEPPEVVVDVDGLTARVVPIPVADGRYRRLGAAKDCLLWVSSPIAGVLGDGRAGSDDKRARPVLQRYDLVKRKLDTIADPVDGYAVTGDGTRLVVRGDGALRVLRSDRFGSSTPVDSEGDEFAIDTGRIVVTVDPTAEWRQMFDEAGRLMRDHFWVEDMAGVDWAAELARYRPLVDAVGSHDDLVDLLWELQGELGTSHAYVGGGGLGDGIDWTARPGKLGADLERDADGGWRVARVLPPETSAPSARSPLSGPGVDVRAGDVILEVAGQPVDPELGPAPLLRGTAGRLVELTVRSAGRAGTDVDGAERDAADGDVSRAGEPGEVRRVVVRPLHDEGPLRYHDWVAGRRAFVADRSDGRLGYLHLPDMMAPGWAQLHRDLSRETARDGLIVDVRANGGGHVSQLVIEKLARRVIGWDVVRHGQPSTYPDDAPRGPVVAVCDELSASDGDVITAAFKRMGVGPVVGVRTWGGVIGIDGRYGLVDGTRVTQPRYASWFDDTGWAVENRGVEPDVQVVITPQDWVAGRDTQLERAVDLALAALDERPATQSCGVITT